MTALALTAGLKSVFAGSGDPAQVLVLRKGVDAELTSTVSNDSYQIIRQLPGIALDPHNQPMVSPEGLTVVNLPSVDSPDGMNVSVRGLLPIGLAMRPLEITQGKIFEAGSRDAIVGESVAKRYPDAHLGGSLKFGRGMWHVVGIFRVGDSAANSEIWVNLDELRGDFEQQGGSSSLLVRTTGAGAAADLKKQIADDQRLGSAVIGEKEYYASMTKSGTPIEGVGFSVAVIMAIGSAFAATNTMYAAVARRTREIGTFRALGFGRFAILLSFMLESIGLALIGGLMGVLIALPVNGLTTAIGSFATFSETAFKFRLSPWIVAAGLAFAATIGAVGGFLPAWSASRKNIVATMRAL
jgi:putative ABC transport system permease protein